MSFHWNVDRWESGTESGVKFPLRMMIKIEKLLQRGITRTLYARQGRQPVIRYESGHICFRL